MKYQKIIMICGLFLTGCSTTMAQQDFNEMDRTLNATLATLTQCKEEVWDDNPEFVNLKKYKLFQKEEDHGKLKYRSGYLGKNERKLLEDMIPLRAVCYDKAKRTIGTHHSHYVWLFSDLFEELASMDTDIRKKLSQGKITAYQAYQSAHNAKIYLQDLYDQQYQDNVDAMNQQHFREQQTNAAMLQALGAGLQNHNQKIEDFHRDRQTSQPTRTQCRWIGDVMNCSSY